MQPPATAAVEIVAEYPSDKFERKGKEGAKLKKGKFMEMFLLRSLILSLLEF